MAQQLRNNSNMFWAGTSLILIIIFFVWYSTIGEEQKVLKA